MDATAYMSVSVLKSMRLPLTSSDGFRTALTDGIT